MCMTVGCFLSQPSPPPLQNLNVPPLNLIEADRLALSLKTLWSLSLVIEVNVSRAGKKKR